MSNKTDTLTGDDMMNDFDVDEEAQFDEMDRMEQRMERMEMDMDIMMNEQIRISSSSRNFVNKDEKSQSHDLHKNHFKVEELRPLIQ